MIPLIRLPLPICFCLLSFILSAQEELTKPAFKIQFDSRRTFVDSKSVNVYGIRAGLFFKEKYGFGLGVYGSRVFNLIGKEVPKNYLDSRLDNSPIPAQIGFEYISVFGEYVVLEKNRWKLTANSQYGFGRVNIRLQEELPTGQLIRESKSLIEHSIRAKYQAFDWLNIIGGLGYRYLLNGKDQIKNAFNAPIYIINTEINFRKLFKGKKLKS